MGKPARRLYHEAPRPAAVKGRSKVLLLPGGRAAWPFGTKAETLARLKPLVRKATVPELYAFTLADWSRSREGVLQSILAFAAGRRLVVRSSAAAEDGAWQSMAGAYRSCLDVDGADPAAIQAAVTHVLASYAGNPRDQLLVQPMIASVALSGVIMTHDLDSGAPYYVVNYDDESGTTDRVTGGVGVNKTVVVHRDFAPHFIESPRVAELLEMTRELEEICGPDEPLDIEFAKANGTLYLLQVRRLAARHNWDPETPARVTESLGGFKEYLIGRSGARPGVAGARTILGQMPDWNPAEMIGSHPRPLPISLYRALITDSVWREARRRMGYREVPNEVLMVVLAGRPYIDVRNSFNSFLPAGLDPRIEEKLINAWLDRLAEQPQLHDKVEFEVAQTALDFTFRQQFQARYAGRLTPHEFGQFQARLLRLTRRNLTLERGGSLRRAQAAVDRLARLQARAIRLGRGAEMPLWHLTALVAQCREDGTLPFSIIARHAFIAEGLLRSAAARGALAPERIGEFKRSFRTVTGALARDYAALAAGRLSPREFLRQYGHLRPGTYDILSPRYDRRPDLFQKCQGIAAPTEPVPFALAEDERRGLQLLLEEAGLDALSPEELLRYAEAAIAGREQAKFVFTRHVSDLLEVIAGWGEGLGASADDLSYLGLDEILESLTRPPATPLRRHIKTLADQRRAEMELCRSIRLGYILRDVRDLYVAPLHRSAPNFVTAARVTGPAAFLDARAGGGSDLAGRVVCIENADPGFDWVFTRKIAGLVTKYGGANSHMTIRCAELRIPAAIGVGEQTFERLVAAGRIELNCTERVVRPADA